MKLEWKLLSPTVIMPCCIRFSIGSNDATREVYRVCNGLRSRMFAALGKRLKPHTEVRYI